MCVRLINHEIREYSMAKEPHSAIPSWSGYIYQGKIAFYEVLRVIKKNLKEDKKRHLAKLKKIKWVKSVKPLTLIDYNYQWSEFCYNFSNYALEVEWQEDFAIKIGDNYKSIHQVKAYKENTEATKYKDAIGGLLRKVQLLFVPAYLHIWTPIKYNNRTTSFEIYRKKNFYFKYYPKKYNKKIEVYKYCTNNEICDLDEADRLILKKIEEIYQENSFGIKSLTSKQYKYIRFKLYELLDKHILEVHKGIKNKNSTMKFNEILEFFKTNYEEYSLEYQQIKVKNYLFLSAITEYCNDSRKCSLDICDKNCSLYKVEEEIKNMSKGEVHQLILNSTPQYDSKFDILTQLSGLKNGLIKTYHQLDLAKKTSNFHYEALDKTYLPSSIIISDEDDKADISKKIILNKDLDSIVNQFEINVIISHNATIEDITKEAKYLKDVNVDFFDRAFENRSSSSINKIKNIKILPLDNIKEEINNAN